MEEVWSVIPGYMGKYWVSNLGRVKRTAHTTVFKSRNQVGEFSCARYYGERVWEKFDTRYGYPYVPLTFNGVSKKHSIHRLVAEAFLPNPDNLPEVNHIDGCTDNNQVVNLEWVTSSENQLHCTRVLGKGLGETHGNCKITNHIVSEIRNLYNEGVSRKCLVEKFNLSKSQIARIVNNTSWKHI
jgi:hypothetical protein